MDGTHKRFPHLLHPRQELVILLHRIETTLHVLQRDSYQCRRCLSTAVKISRGDLGEAYKLEDVSYFSLGGREGVWMGTYCGMRGVVGAAAVGYAFCYCVFGFSGEGSCGVVDAVPGHSLWWVCAIWGWCCRKRRG